VNLVFSRESLKEYLYWQRTDPEILLRINRLIKETMRDPYRGIGEPELVKHGLQGNWSRRITRQDRIVYRVIKSDAWIAQLRYHYSI
jgi:toxin YoeB